jgi:hypothetical protein
VLFLTEAQLKAAVTDATTKVMSGGDCP